MDVHLVWHLYDRYRGAAYCCGMADEESTFPAPEAWAYWDGTSTDDDVEHTTTGCDNDTGKTQSVGASDDMLGDSDES